MTHAWQTNQPYQQVPGQEDIFALAIHQLLQARDQERTPFPKKQICIRKKDIPGTTIPCTCDVFIKSRQKLAKIQI